MLAAIQAQWRPLRAELFTRLMLLDLSNPRLLIGQSFRGGRPDPSCWTAPVPARTCRHGVPVAVDALGDFIGDLLLEHSAPDVGVVVALPRQLGHWCVIEWPDGHEPEEAADVLREERLDLGWPFSLDAASLAVQPLAAAPGCSLVVASSAEAVEGWVETFAIAGAVLRHLIPAQACLHLAMRQHLEQHAADELVALLQPDQDGCTLLVWRDGVPEFERQLPAETDALLPALSQALGFCRSRLGGGSIRLLLGEALETAPALAEQLGLQLDVLEHGEYGSPHLAGLGELVLAR